jgi:hypothetical protein
MKPETAPRVNVVNVGEHIETAMFTTYPHETKGLVNVVNVARGYFGSSRTFLAKRKILLRGRCSFRMGARANVVFLRAAAYPELVERVPAC